MVGATEALCTVKIAPELAQSVAGMQFMTRCYRDAKEQSLLRFKLTACGEECVMKNHAAHHQDKPVPGPTNSDPRTE